MIDQSKIIWTGKSTGVVLEEYQGKFSLKAVQKYTSQGQEKVSYDWTYKEKYDPELKKRVMPEKANNANGVYLGDESQAQIALATWLKELRGSFPAQKQEEESDIPF